MGRRVVRFVAVPLTQGQRAKVSPEDGWVLSYNWYARWAESAKTYYAYRKVQGKSVAMHRAVLDAPDGMDVHHRNGDGLDNRRSNIVVCTRAQNLAARSNWGRYPKGVTLKRARGVYVAHIMFEGQKIYLGQRATPEEAARLYDDAAKELYGEFAYLNYPDGN